MQIFELNSARLIKRYKRFLADVQLANGQIITIHCPNTGAMTGCADTDDIVWFSTSTNTKRKYPHTWELTQKSNGDLICVNTLRANQIVYEGLLQKKITELSHYQQIQPEVKYGSENSRIDFLLTALSSPDCYLEVKATTLLGNNSIGYFPDTTTTRGQKHLRELIQIQSTNKSAVILFAILHSGIKSFSVAKHIDPHYADLLQLAQKSNIKVLTYATKFQWITENTISIEIDEKIT